MHLYALGGGYPTCSQNGKNGQIGRGLSSNFSQNSSTYSCSACTSGTFALQSMCNSCPKGKYSNIRGATGCLSCSAGNYSAVRKSKSCSACKKGTYSVGTDNTVCSVCTNGTYSPTISSTSCTDCGLGSISNLGASVCTVCQAGQFSSKKSSFCSSCAKGFSSLSGSNVCTACGIGTYASTIGTKSCNNCDPGSISESIGAISCVPCKRGEYSSSSKECSLCKWPTASFIEGSSSCQYYRFSYNDNVQRVGSIIVVLFGCFIYGIGIFFVDEIPFNNLRGVVVTRLGVFLFLLLPFLDSLSNMIYLFHNIVHFKAIFALLLIFTILPSIFIFLFFLFILKPRPKPLFIFIFPLGFLWIAVGVILFQTKIFTIKRIWNFWFFVFTGFYDFDNNDDGLNSCYTNKSLLYSSIFETIPLIFLQILNNNNVGWNYLSALSTIFSFCFLIKCFLRFPFYSLHSPIQHIPITFLIGKKVYLDTTGDNIQNNIEFAPHNSNNNINNNLNNNNSYDSNNNDINNNNNNYNYNYDNINRFNSTFIEENILILDNGEIAVVAQVQINQKINVKRAVVASAELP